MECNCVGHWVHLEKQIHADEFIQCSSDTNITKPLLSANFNGYSVVLEQQIHAGKFIQCCSDTNITKPCGNTMLYSIPSGKYHTIVKKMVVCPEMCVFCWDVLYCHLNEFDPPETPSFPNDSYPLFVTWRIGTEKLLRGSVGTFDVINLQSGLEEYALRSALEDPRFRPITKDELCKLHVTVSILKEFEYGCGYLDWEIGKHGIFIEFTTGKGYKSTVTCLPEVAVLHGLDHTEIIDALLRKGGYEGTITSDVRKSIRLTRYQTECFAVSYSNFEKICRN